MHIRSTRVAAVLVAVAASGTGALSAAMPVAAAGSNAYLFSPVADTYVESTAPSADFGRADRLVADAEPTTEAYLRFAVSGVRGTVTSARLRLYALDSSGRTGGTVVRMQRTTWPERGTTFATRPGTTGRTVATLGPVRAGTWVDVDVTSAIAGDGVVSFGIRTDSRDGVDYASRHSTLHAPRLIVTSSSAVSGGDRTPPTVRISKPATGTRITTSARVSIEAAASDASGVRKVEFYANGLYMGTEETAPFGYTWSVSSADNGAHRWTARAYDRAGNVATSGSVTVVVDIAEASGAPITTDAQVPARAETASVRHSGDAADDPAIWRHPADPSLSLVLGTDKEGGLAVYDLQGRERQYIAGIRPNNVDLRGDIVTASDRDTDTILIYRVDRVARRLVNVRAVARDTGFGVAGLCMYTSRTGLYVFVTDSSGTVKQFRLSRTSTGRYDYRQVRQLEVSTSEIEGCVADDYHGGFYVSDEDRAIWRYGAEPTSGSTRVKVDGHSSGRLSGDIEGLTVVRLGYGQGYLIASSQGSDSYAVYERRTHRYRGRFRIAGGSVDGVTYTDGIDAHGSLGLFVAQDDSNDGGNQNFKLVAWPRIAAALGLRAGLVQGNAAPVATVL